jgi:hypothetical protein
VVLLFCYHGLFGSGPETTQLQDTNRCPMLPQPPASSNCRHWKILIVVRHEIASRVYSDTVTGETMLLRAVIEETESEIAVISLYKTSKLIKYLPEEPT